MAAPLQQMLIGSIVGRTQTTTWNPSDKAAGITLSSGNLVATGSGSAWNNVRATTSKTSSKRYFEYIILSRANPPNYCGLMDGSSALTGNPPGYVGNSCGQATMATATSESVAAGTFALAGASFTGAWAVNDVMGIAVDMSGKAWVSQNGVYVSSGVPDTGTTPLFTFTGGTTIFPAMGAFTSGDSVQLVTFGGTYSPPTGFQWWDV